MLYSKQDVIGVIERIFIRREREYGKRRQIMSRSTILLVIVLAVLECVPLAHPQTFPVAEGYLGFTVLNNEYGTDRQNSPGVQFGFGYNVHRNLRILADFGAETHDTKIVWTNGKKASADSYQLLFGPELTIRSKSSVTPFFHGLVGVAFRNYAVPTGNWDCSLYSCYETSFSIARDTGLATGVGGGIDWQFHSVCPLRFHELLRLFGSAAYYGARRQGVLALHQRQ
jgi:hypothetical protein